MTTNIYHADLILTNNGFVKDHALVIDESGTITAITDDLSKFDPATVTHFSNRVILPGAVNSHSHAFQILIRGRADNPLNFRDWVDNHLYPLVLDADEDLLYAGALLAFAEMIQNGATTVGEFYYIHNEKGTYNHLGNKLSDIAIQAAKDVGLRICLLRTLYDASAKEGQKRFSEPAEVAGKHTEELFDKYKDDPLVTVLPAPHSLHGAGEKAILKGLELAEKWDVKYHIHLAEEKHDLAFSDKLYGTTPLRSLEKIGALGERTVIVHGCHLDDEEVEMLGKVGGGLAYNPISNLALGDGISPIEKYIDSGVTVSLGTDGACANNGVNVYAEMRAAEQLQRVSQFRMGVIPGVADKFRYTSNYQFEMGTVNGAKNLCLNTGILEVGKAADFVVLDLDDLSLLPDFGCEEEALLNNVVNAMSIRSALTEVVVGGEVVMRDGELTRVSEKEVVHTLRRAVEKWQGQK